MRIEYKVERKGLSEREYASVEHNGIEVQIMEGLHGLLLIVYGTSRSAQYDRRTGARTWVSTDAFVAPSADELATMDAIAAGIAPIAAAQGDLYIRFGALPTQGRSRNHATGSSEAGVSAYDAAIDYRGGYRLADSPATFDPHLLGRSAYVITGRRVGTGSDGESVVVDAEIIAKVAYDQATDRFLA
jgi:hypothetical protein